MSLSISHKNTLLCSEAVAHSYMPVHRASEVHQKIAESLDPELTKTLPDEIVDKIYRQRLDLGNLPRYEPHALVEYASLRYHQERIQECDSQRGHQRGKAALLRFARSLDSKRLRTTFKQYNQTHHDPQVQARFEQLGSLLIHSHDPIAAYATHNAVTEKTPEQRFRDLVLLAKIAPLRKYRKRVHDKMMPLIEQLPFSFSESIDPAEDLFTHRYPHASIREMRRVDHIWFTRFQKLSLSERRLSLKRIIHAVDPASTEEYVIYHHTTKQQAGQALELYNDAEKTMITALESFDRDNDAYHAFLAIKRLAARDDIHVIIRHRFVVLLTQKIIHSDIEREEARSMIQYVLQQAGNRVDGFSDNQRLRILWNLSTHLQSHRIPHDAMQPHLEKFFQELRQVAPIAHAHQKTLITRMIIDLFHRNSLHRDLEESALDIAHQCAPLESYGNIDSCVTDMAKLFTGSSLSGQVHAPLCANSAIHAANFLLARTKDLQRLPITQQLQVIERATDLFLEMEQTDVKKSTVMIQLIGKSLLHSAMKLQCLKERPLHLITSQLMSGGFSPVVSLQIFHSVIAPLLQASHLPPLVLFSRTPIIRGQLIARTSHALVKNSFPASEKESLRNFLIHEMHRGAPLSEFFQKQLPHDLFGWVKPEHEKRQS